MLSAKRCHGDVPMTAIIATWLATTKAPPMSQTRCTRPRLANAIVAAKPSTESA